MALSCTALVSVLFLIGADLAWSALGGASLMMLLCGRAPERLFDAVGWTGLREINRQERQERQGFHGVWMMRLMPR